MMALPPGRPATWPFKSWPGQWTVTATHWLAIPASLPLETYIFLPLPAFFYYYNYLAYSLQTTFLPLLLKALKCTETLP